MNTADCKIHDPKEYCRRKMGYCVNRAKENSYFVRCEPKIDKPEYRRLRKEAMQDAREWKRQYLKA